MWLTIYFVLSEASRSRRQNITSWDVLVHSMAWWEYFRWLHFNCCSKKKHGSVSCLFTVLLDIQSSHSSCCTKETVRFWQATEFTWQSVSWLITWAEQLQVVINSSPLQLENKTGYSSHLQWDRSMQTLSWHTSAMSNISLKPQEHNPLQLSVHIHSNRATADKKQCFTLLSDSLSALH